jgi:hypothetical protein
VFCVPPLYEPNWNMHLLSGTPLHWQIWPNSKEFKENLLPYAIADIFVGICCSNYECILARLNLSTLYSRQQHLDALFLINVFKSKVSCSSIFDSVCIQIPTRIITDYSTFMVNHNFKVSPSARCVSAANTICKDTDIFDKNYTSLTDIL